MGTVSIQGNTYDIHGTYDEAQIYFFAATHATAWTAATQINRQKAQVTATRMIDRQPWQGLPTDQVTPQPLAWPRTGVVDRKGQAVDDATTPDDVNFGTYELANALLADATVQTAKNSGTNTKRELLRQKVGDLEEETETERFRGTDSGANAASRFPTIVHELVGQYLESGASLLGIFASGLDALSAFVDGSDDYGFSRGLS